MIVYDDLKTREKIQIYDVRVERPPHYDTFAEFEYSYHYGDSYIPHVQLSEPLKAVCAHFLECIANGTEPMSGGQEGLELVKILEAANRSLKSKGASVPIAPSRQASVIPTVVRRRDGLKPLSSTA
jgi:predicted dehydrogenase